MRHCPIRISSHGTEQIKGNGKGIDRWITTNLPASAASATPQDQFICINTITVEHLPVWVSLRPIHFPAHDPNNLSSHVSVRCFSTSSIHEEATNCSKKKSYKLLMGQAGGLADEVKQRE
jgi:hypothetical protein